MQADNICRHSHGSIILQYHLPQAYAWGYLLSPLRGLERFMEQTLELDFCKARVESSLLMLNGDGAAVAIASFDSSASCCQYVGKKD